MPYLVSGATCLDAWRAAVNYLIGNGREASNILVTIFDPTHFDPVWLSKYDPRRNGKQFNRIRDVTNLIFPQDILSRVSTATDFYNRYASVQQRARRMGRMKGRWGTYFERLIAEDGAGVNQLDEVITKINNWSRKRYSSALYIHLSSRAQDSPKTIGNPCLQYIQFSLPDPSVVSMTAIYRNHDYHSKALGNFIGLSRLLSFVCRETGRSVGTITCHSIHAYFDISISQMKAFVAL